MGTIADLKAKRDSFIRPSTFSFEGEASAVFEARGARSPEPFYGGRQRASDVHPALASVVPSDALDDFRALVVRARTNRVLRERAYENSLDLFQRILRALDEKPLSKTDLNDRFFRSVNVKDLAEVLRALEAAGLVASQRVDTDGRPREMWRKTPSLPRAEVNGA